MDLCARTAPGDGILDEERPLLAVPLFSDALEGEVAKAVDERVGGALARLARGGDFAAEPAEVAALYPASGPSRLLLVGLGKKADATLGVLRRAAAAAAKRARALRAGEVTFWVPKELLDAKLAGALELGRAILEAAALAAYVDERFKPKAGPDAAKRPGPAHLTSFEIAGPDGALEAAAGWSAAIADGVRTAREVGNLPGNAGPPRVLADRALAMAEETGLSVVILDEQRMDELGMGALLGVAMGSGEPPRFIILEHGADRDEAPLVLIGKGVTFDTGGISIKPSDKMEEMKWDKCGGAAVLGAMEAIARTRLPRRVIGLIPAAENMPGAAAQRPGDIRTALDGQTIEVINTDAEGRLLLADAIAYACAKYEPAAIIDIATLTGACWVALGTHYAGLMSNDDALADELLAAARAVGERTWRLPLDADYDEQLKSAYADMKNTGGRPGGAITAAQFLKRFVKEGTPWAHLDIAGVAWVTDEKPLYMPGATGFGVRLLTEWAWSREESGT